MRRYWENLWEGHDSTTFPYITKGVKTAIVKPPWKSGPIGTNWGEKFQASNQTVFLWEKIIQISELEIKWTHSKCHSQCYGHAKEPKIVKLSWKSKILAFPDLQSIAHCASASEGAYRTKNISQASVYYYVVDDHKLHRHTKLCVNN